MTKQQAILIFGTRQRDLADAIGVTRSAVAQWPDVLTQKQTDLVIGAAVRLGRMDATQYPGVADSHGESAEAA